MPTAKQVAQMLADGNVSAADRQAFNALSPEDQDAIMAEVQSIEQAGLSSRLGGLTSASLKQQLGGSYQTPAQRTDASFGANTNRQVAEITDRSNRAAADDLGYFDRTVQPQLDEMNRGQWRSQVAHEATLGGRAQDQANYQNEWAGIMGEQRSLADRTVAERNQQVGDYQRQLGAYNQRDQGSYDQFMRETQPLMRELQSTGYGANVQFDAEGLGMQRNAASQFQGIANGSLDYQAAQAQAAQAQAVMAAVERARSNPQDVRAQQEAARMLQSVAGGSLDVQADPEAIAAQKKASGRFDELSNPEITAQERFLLEQSRRAGEQTMRAQRAAVLEDQGFRGVRSGAAELGSMYDLQERVGQDRVLAELGAQAQAVGRAQRNLESYADLNTNIRNQSYAESAGNADRRLGGMNSYGEITSRMREASDNMNMFNTSQVNETNRFNAGQQNQVNMFNADQRTQVSMFNAGQTNQARANNQATRLAGTQGYANQANEIRAANDDINKFNKEQSMIQARHQDQFRQNEAVRQGNLADTRLRGGLDTTRQQSDRTNLGFDAAERRTNDNERTQQETIGLRRDANDSIFDSRNQLSNEAEQQADRYFDTPQRAATTATGIAGTRSGIVGQGLGWQNDATGLQMEADAVRRGGLGFSR